MLSKKLLFTVGAFIIVYTLLYFMFSVPAFENVAANTLLGSTVSLLKMSHDDVQFAQAIDRSDDNRISMRIGYASETYIKKLKDEARRKGLKQVNASMRNAQFYLGYYTMPFIFMLALILVTPLPWRQRLIVLLLGALLYYLFTLLRMRIAMNVHLAEMNELDNSWVGLQRSMVGIMQIGFSFAVALLIWFVLAFRRSNWKNIIHQLNQLQSASKKT